MKKHRQYKYETGEEMRANWDQEAYEKEVKRERRAAQEWCEKAEREGLFGTRRDEDREQTHNQRHEAA